MGKLKHADTLALKKSDQKKVVRQTKALTKKVIAGQINVHETKKQEKQALEETRGLIYIAHLPHGFYEEELRAYFKQFGHITNVKVGRSRKTGNCKGFGYVEFVHPDVAKIAAETMNNYLMFKKRVVAEYVPYEKRPKHLFHGKSSNQESFTVKTRRAKQALFKNKQLTDEEITKRKIRVVSSLSKKVNKLKALGIDADLELTKKLLKKTGESVSELTHIYQAETSVVDLKVKLKKKKGTAIEKGKVREKKTTPKLKAKKAKTIDTSSDSVSLLSSSEKLKAKKVDKFNVTSKLKKLEGIVKKAKTKTKKNLTLNPDKVKKIAANIMTSDALVNVKKIKKSLKKK